MANVFHSLVQSGYVTSYKLAGNARKGLLDGRSRRRRSRNLPRVLLIFPTWGDCCVLPVLPLSWGWTGENFRILFFQVTFRSSNGERFFPSSFLSLSLSASASNTTGNQGTPPPREPPQITHVSLLRVAEGPPSYSYFSSNLPSLRFRFNSIRRKWETETSASYFSSEFGNPPKKNSENFLPVKVCLLPLLYNLGTASWFSAS